MSLVNEQLSLNSQPLGKGKELLGQSKLTQSQIEAVHRTIREVYLSDNRPWIIGYSGGKDSTTALQLIWYALRELPPTQLTKPIYVISSDTLVETPVITDALYQSLDRMNDAAKTQGFPLTAQLVQPPVTETFWVNMIGRGYPAPYNRFRWCTDRLKIGPANKFIQDRVDKHGEVVLVLGVRKSESATRRQVMELHRRVGHRLSRHSQLINAWVFTPIEDWDLPEVWAYLTQVPNPWGNRNHDLVTMYRNATGECPLVVDKTTPSCGNSRFGCWTCTVVERDRSMEACIDNGAYWMEHLLDVRDFLTNTRNPEEKWKYRSHRRRTGRVDTWGDNDEKIIWGPYTMEFRRQILEMVLEAQVNVRLEGPDANLSLIQEEELHEIRRIWRAEEGDWEDSLPQIYQRVVGTKLPWFLEEDGGPTQLEASVLAQIAAQHELPIGLLRQLLDVERIHRGMSRRS
ncbi:MAG: DNA phosphorothioation system sulfurtransferase DndC, partial [Proteobacteria bacterium]|nr:DNA phosphorothioation system sulfurtransferase DndC [Pseudomonadota bacterium]